MIYLPDLMKEIRMDRGLSQAKVARSLGLTPQSYHRYEKGERKANLELIYGLAEFYKISVIHFLSVAPTKKFIPDFELEELPRHMRHREPAREYSLFDIAYQFEELYLKTNKSYQKYRSLLKSHSKKLKSLNQRYFQTEEIKKLNKEYKSLKVKLNYFEVTLKEILSEKMREFTF